MDYLKDEPIWVERYRPQKIDDCILPDSIKGIFKEILQTGVVPNMLLSGTSGVGKTTIAKALCKELDASYIVINASSENGIDMVRNDMTKFASKASITGGRKVIILDEADYLSKNAQPALRGVIEEFSKTTSVILTCNYVNKIIDPLRSRLKNIEFKISHDEKSEMMKLFFFRCCEILKNENVNYDKEVLAKLIKKLYPDNRKIINELQAYSRGGEIDESIFTVIDTLGYDKLIEAIKNKKFNLVKQWVMDNSDNDMSSIYYDIYKNLVNEVKQNSVPEMVLTIAEWQKYHSSVADQSLNVLAMLTELMGSVDFN